MLVHGVHGWGEQDGGSGSVGSLAPYIEQSGCAYRVHEHTWPRLHTLALLAQRRRTREEAETLAPQLHTGDGLVTYSNGAPVARHALLQTDAYVPLWVMIAPALADDIEIPHNVGRVIVLHSNSDLALIAGWLWTWVNPASWVLGHDWGLLGRIGYQGKDPRVTNWPARPDRTVRHLGWFDPDPLEHWGPRIQSAFAIERVKGEA